MTDRPRFDPTINLGHLISLGGVMCAIVGSWWLMDHRLSQLEKGMERLTSVVIEYARLDARVTEHSRRIDKLESK